MKVLKQYLLLCIAALVYVSCDKSDGWASLTAEKHPRIFADNEEFALMKEKIKKGDNPILTEMHKNAMKLADEHGLNPATIVYQKDASEKRILSVSRETICRIFSAAYAYRFTGRTEYLEHAERDINTVCNFPDWNPSHYLDCAEMSAAVSIGYDWLYNELQDSTKANVRKALQSKAFDTYMNGSLNSLSEHWTKSATNWNQVCNAGLTLAALATFEEYPKWAKKFIIERVESNRLAMNGIYPPKGAYAEGPVYWNYGNLFETVMLSALETTLGTDFGLADTEGFSETGLFEAFLDGNTNQFFNYSDNLAERIPLYPLWYLAWRFDRPEILFREQAAVFRNNYAHIECERLLPLYVIYASRIDPSSIREPEQKVLFSNGVTPIATIRTGWNDKDKYLAAKGGSPGNHHAHMDAGEFIYDADGIRWAADLSRQEYVELENPCRQLGGDFWDFSQNSVRWRCFRFGTERHNTLTINGRQQNVSGNAIMTETFDTTGLVGVTFDLTSLYTPAVSSVVRTIALENGSRLRITDKIRATADAPAHIRWTLVTQSKPEITPDGIILRADGVEKRLLTNTADVRFRQWPSDPAQTDKGIAFFDFPVDECICGYEYDIQAGEYKEITTVLQ